MSFTWQGVPLLTREQIAARVHTVSLGLGLDRLAAVIALMTIDTEVGTGSGDTRSWWCPANPAVTESLGFPHDSLSNDSRSMGYFQQQPGPRGEPWWGETADMMTLESAATSFLTRLPADYRTAGGDPYRAGMFAQRVQQSAFPDRYARAWDSAWDVLRRAIDQPTGELVADVRPDYGITKRMHGFNPGTGPGCTGNSNGPRARTLYVVLHTQEGDGTAVSLANYLNTHQVSYNLVADGVDTVEVVPVTEGPWAAMEANDIGVHICFAGSRAAWQRDDWLAREPMLRRAAKAVAAACAQFNIPPVKVLAGGGWPVTPKGIAAHADFGKRGGGHTDPGPEFPWETFIDFVKHYLTPTLEAPVNPAPDNPYAIPKPGTESGQVAQLWDQDLIRWDMFGGRTRTEAIAAIGAKLGIDGFEDAR